MPGLQRSWKEALQLCMSNSRSTAQGHHRGWALRPMPGLPPDLQFNGAGWPQMGPYPSLYPLLPEARKWASWGWRLNAAAGRV